MKTTKRVLAVLLALALGLALFAPMAMAADPVITGVTPQNPVARTGKSITLTVEAQPPQGAETPLAYQWYQWVDDDWQAIAGATTKNLAVTATLEEFITGYSGMTLDNMLFGLSKQYQVIVSCGEGQASQDASAVFFPGFFDNYSGTLQVIRELAMDLFGLSDISDSALNFASILVFPLMLFNAAMLWSFSSLAYYTLR